MVASGIAGYKMMEWYWEGRMERRAGIYLAAWNNGEEDATSSREGKVLSSVALKRKMTFREDANGLQKRVTQFW